MMIRKAESFDIPEMVSLLRLSLGENLVPKSENYWHWKHEENPFGPSEILLAMEHDRIIGVRAFMRWNWESEYRTHHALRAVDTVVHPDYRGKGIFKKLTTTLRDQCRDDGYDFIFNTPNEQSRPGYLHMGWQDSGRIAIRLKPVFPFFLEKKTLPVDWDAGAAIDQYTTNHQQPIPDKWCTAKNQAYLRWRYASCPVINYFGYTHPQQGWLLIVYPKKTSRGIELRITEWLPGSDVPSRQELKRGLHQCIQSFKPTYIAISPNVTMPIRSFLSTSGFLPAFSSGPKLTYYPLNPEIPQQVKISDFHYTVGDLELF